ncbi:MAG: PLP-dependent aminotransferase family protein [Candidatus Ancillula sp.]|jgi:DNA-binding transcriptional MocR family regulator|nr:PLP-dependent aminotransferase family protein [Candidatus Ancillula sp.]
MWYNEGMDDDLASKWENSYSDDARVLTRSEIRTLFAVVAEHPEVVSLAGGMPSLDQMPFAEISKVLADVVAKRGAELWQYGTAQGDERLRELVLDICKLEGVQANKDNVVLTSGSQQALDYITRLFINPDDVVLCEEPIYVGAKGIFASYRADIISIKMDGGGLIPELLEKTIIEQEKQNKKIKFLYTVPNFHNPASVTLLVERRPKVLEICKKHGILIIEDNPYGLLSFEGELYPSIYSFDYSEDSEFSNAAENVIYLGSFSKIIAPGFRVGYAIAPSAICEKLVLCAEAATLCSSTNSQMTLVAYLENFDWMKRINLFRKSYKERSYAMITALEKYLPECTFEVPHGGFYIWLKLPEGVRSDKLLPYAFDAGVVYVPGTGFYADNRGAEYIRISFCYPNSEEITAGIKHLKSAIDNYKKQEALK